MSKIKSFLKKSLPDKLYTALRHFADNFFRTKEKTPKSYSLDLDWIRYTQDSWLAKNFSQSTISIPSHRMQAKIEKLFQQTNSLGPRLLWEGYADLESYSRDVKNSSRSASQVSTRSSLGNFYAYLVEKKKPSVVVEFGTAFGISGMYWLAGLENNNQGELLTFEPNKDWAEIASKNLSAISGRFKLTVGTFEDNIKTTLGNSKRIDVAFIDAIHTSEFVFSQFEIVCSLASPNAIVILDDIYFSEDMTNAWEKIAIDPRINASVAIERVGIVEIVSQ